MANKIIGLWDNLVPLVVALCLTGTNAQCEPEYNAFSECVSSHLLPFLPLGVGSSCNRKLIPEDLCQMFATVVRCVNGVNASSACRRDAVLQIRQQLKFICDLDDLQEVCTKAPALDTGESIHTTTSTSIAITGQIMESTTLVEDESTLKVSETNAQCGQQEYNAFFECVYPHESSFLPLTVGSFCNRKLITEDLCLKFATIVRCVNGVNASSACRREAVIQISEQMSFICKLDDLQEVCTKAPVLDTGKSINTTISSSKAVEGQTMESTTGSENESSFKAIGGCSVPQASMVLLMIHKIMLTLVL